MKDPEMPRIEGSNRVPGGDSPPGAKFYRSYGCGGPPCKALHSLNRKSISQPESKKEIKPSRYQLEEKNIGGWLNSPWNYFFEGPSLVNGAL